MEQDSIVEFLGETLVSKSGEIVQTRSLYEKNEFIGLYYSAHWCPSCIAFTPELVLFYRNFNKSGKKGLFEIIYISSDYTEKQYKDHMNSMPWLSLPFSDRQRPMDLARKYRVQSIPALVIIEANSGKLITSFGRACVMDDPLGLCFPWKMRHSTEVLTEISLISATNGRVSFDTISDSIKGLYFSAHWCPPCKAFTPILVKLYKKLKKAGKKFEIIFVSSDRSEQSFKQYFSTMPWLAVPFSEEKKRKELGYVYGVGGIPSLILLDESNFVITKEGRLEVNEDPDGEDFPWKPKLVDELAEKHFSKLNEEPCLIFFTSCEEKEMELAHFALLPVAEEYEARLKRASIEENPIPKLNFFYAGDAEICDSVRDIIGFGDESPFLVILDIANSKKYIHDKKDAISSETIGKFVRDFLSQKLMPCVIGN
ncbi:nucleoredoxin-like [Uloborus diversus]|uniref:nucleoredoxin-like n=1 Tax=Uloborus diversus TaxID=327109 RepID=UPI00240A01D4|nr:nucleoredoxin-like [Uloborus diversus]